MAHKVKCVKCGCEFDRDKIQAVRIGARRYGHATCYPEITDYVPLVQMTEEEKELKNLEEYIKQIYKIDYIDAKIRKQIKDYKEQYNYTYSGIQKTLYWWFELKNNSIEKANDGIGIVPFVYQDACDYFYRLYLAKIANDVAPEVIHKPKIREIEIDSPRADVAPPKLFNFEEEGTEK